MAEDLVILVVPSGGQDGLISHGDRCWAPYRENHLDPTSRWLVEVPRFAAIHFCRKGGFYELT